MASPKLTVVRRAVLVAERFMYTVEELCTDDYTNTFGNLAEATEESLADSDEWKTGAWSVDPVAKLDPDPTSKIEVNIKLRGNGGSIKVFWLYVRHNLSSGLELRFTHDPNTYDISDKFNISDWLDTITTTERPSIVKQGRILATFDTVTKQVRAMRAAGILHQTTYDL